MIANRPAVLEITSELFNRIRGASFIAVVSLLSGASAVDAAQLYGASLQNGAYGGGFIVDTFSSACSDRDGSSCGDGNLSNIGITNASAGVVYTANNAVINYSIGRDRGATAQTLFRTHGTVSVSFLADAVTFASGQPFVDNPGFSYFNSGQASFGTGFSRVAGLDAALNTSDDLLSVGWWTWHAGSWRHHISTPVLLAFDQWHDIGFAWGGSAYDFELWVDGVRVAGDDVPAGWSAVWGSGDSAYNFALGEIHERISGNSSPYGITFANLEIWNEYLASGATVAPVPVPASLWLAASALLPLLRRKSGDGLRISRRAPV
jgi:hypothetical protein